ncbi:hypothetical protein [Acidovorax sp. SUPP2539]|uniref:hypothetical protein n=1 Tax=Acidovorax sp. SUPP2539 TaxID=2920878 RepID=UPI0023DE51BC|nr:hypothetical protein [Acidovorax sp. SUPP2539]GKS92760.1 hypothetical protein AVTE2539_25365 [Acidovorax sp. SUPP2539]
MASDPTTTRAAAADLPEALRLADWLQSCAESVEHINAAAELRRMHALTASAPAASSAPAVAPADQAALFDAQGFRDFVLRDMPDDTIIGSSSYWADHLTAWAKRFVKAAPTAPQAGAPADMADAYSGAREDLAIWKRRALEAERDLRAERETSARLASALNDANGPMHLGEPAPQKGAPARALIGAACAAITRRHDATKTLAELRRCSVGDLSNAAPAPQAGAESYPPSDAAALEKAMKERWLKDGSIPAIWFAQGWAAAADTAALRARGAVPSDAEPDLVWSFDDPEEGGFGPDEMADRISDDMSESEGGGVVVRVSCAKNLLSRKMRVWFEKDDEGDRVTHWEWVGSSTPAAPMSAHRPSPERYRELIEQTMNDDFHIGPTPMSAQPSDADLDALCVQISDYDDAKYFRHMARAVLARWGGAPNAPADQAYAPLPPPGRAMAQIEATLQEYGYPSNPTNAARAGFEAARRMLAAAPQPPAAPGGQDACGALVIQVEKALCAKLGIAWAPVGMSIESLIDRLAAKGQEGSAA